MKRLDAIPQMQATARQWHREGLRIGLVPTMGYLHDGHVSLIRAALERSDRVIVSLFVNPTQFAPGEDLASYPRDLERDARLCEAEGAHILFCPTADDMYPPGYSTWVVEEKLGRHLCGARREGHFRGVTTVVAKLFNACLPDLAVFGQKDAQQARVIQRMSRDLNFPIEILVAPIIRETDGLAMSSRNIYLSSDERIRALAINRGLDQAEAAFRAGERHAEALCRIVREQIVEAGGIVDYVECRDHESLETIDFIDRESLLAVAARFGKARLLDNRILR